MARVYPNGKSDVNDFHNNGGMSFIISTLIEHGFLHVDVETIYGDDLTDYTKTPTLRNGAIVWEKLDFSQANKDILRAANDPFSDNGGLKVLKGNLGTSVIKTSAVKSVNRCVKAPAVVFSNQDRFVTEFKKGNLNKDFVAVFPLSRLYT